MKLDIKDFTRREVTEYLVLRGFRRYASVQIFNWIYKKKVEDFSCFSDISLKLRDYLQNNFYFSSLKVKRRRKSYDGTEKFLFDLGDNLSIESVFIPEGERNTLCLSTQVGCKFGCKFCISGLGGFKRNLSVSEIINQFLGVEKLVSPQRITNIVFMGVGEPLDNFDNLVRAIDIFMDNKGLYLGRRKICISTSGLIPQIEKLTDLKLGVKLSVSLHSAEDYLRSRIMRVNKIYPLNRLKKALQRFVEVNKSSVTLEYVLIKGLNSSKKDAIKLVEFTEGLKCKVNLISYNPSPYFKWKPPSGKEIEEFQKVLKNCGVFSTLRKARGQDITAACGQLRAFINN